MQGQPADPPLHKSSGPLRNPPEDGATPVHNMLCKAANNAHCPKRQFSPLRKRQITAD